MKNALNTVVLAVLLTLLVPASSSAQQVDRLAEIRDYQILQIKSWKIDEVMYLALTKPYGMWDSRPLSAPTVTISGEQGPAKDVPNYLWGSVGTTVFSLPQERLLSYPEEFLKQSYFNRQSYREYADRNRREIIAFVAAIRKSSKSIFVQQNMLPEHRYVRVDDVFRENGISWRYKIPAGSP